MTAEQALVPTLTPEQQARWDAYVATAEGQLMIAAWGRMRLDNALRHAARQAEAPETAQPAESGRVAGVH